MRKRQKESKEQEFIIMNEYNEVFSGLKNGGKFKWSSDWNEAKPLEYSNTIFIRILNSKVELIKTQDFY